MKPYFFVIIILLIFSSTDCKKNPVAPPPAESDTTNHAFIFNIFTFGGGGGSVLNDVAIINDTLVYAVGSIYLTDSTGQYDPFPYNLAVWHGTSWNFKRVTVNFRGNLITSPLEGVFAFSPTDIWLMATDPIHGDGQNWNDYDIRTITGNNALTVSRGWGENSSSIYFVGRHGTIVHYDGSSWKPIETGTALQVNDIWGAQNPQTGQLEILAVASDDINKKLLRIQGTTVTTVADGGLSASLNGVWFIPSIKYYVVGAGIAYKNTLNNSPWSSYPSGIVTSYASGGVRGNDTSDVFVAGSFFELVHYNGRSWHNYKDVIPFTDGAVGRLAVKGNLMVTVGLSGQNAVAIIGQRE